MATYAFTVGSTPKTMQGTLTWNQNGTLRTLAITDGFNSGGTQTCNYGTSTTSGYDDLGRLVSVNCGSIWAQTFSYDPFGNLTKSGSLTWNPGYNLSTNRYTLGGTSYDANGNLLNDTFHTYSWDADGHLVTIDSTSCGTNGTCLLYDALGRMVEKSVNATFTHR
jgi:YD repeat-containing protein